MLNDCTNCARNAKDNDALEIVKSAVVQGLCERCFRQQYINPLIKQRETSQAIVDQLDAQIKQFSNELNRAKQLVDTRTPIGEVAEKLRQRQLAVQRGDLRAFGYVFCRKCHTPFEGAIECKLHEEQCKIFNPKRDSQGRPVKLRVVRTPDDLDNM